VSASVSSRSARLSAALLGAPLAALLFTIGVTAVMPGSSDLRLLTAMLVVFPAMVAGVALALWSRSGARAWLVCLGLGALGVALWLLARG